MSFHFFCPIYHFFRGMAPNDLPERVYLRIEVFATSLRAYIYYELKDQVALAQHEY